MLHIASTFESSLRREASSPLTKKHACCKGTAHGSGSYGCTNEKECDLANNSPFQRNNSKRWSKRSNLSKNTSDAESINSCGVEKSPFQRSSSSRWSAKKSEKKTASVSSENFSESDSLDSLGEKIKSSDTTDEATKKGTNIVNRLFNNVTKSSIAKTAKMRHLDIFDVDDSNWIGGLRKNTSDDSQTKKPSDTDTIFYRSKNGSFRRKSVDSNTDTTKQNGITEGTVKKVESSFQRSSIRNSFRKNLAKKLSKWKTVSFDDILFMSTNKKSPGFFISVDINDCFKEFMEFLKNQGNEVSVLSKQFLNFF